jgi:hypothetical protein
MNAPEISAFTSSWRPADMSSPLAPFEATSGQKLFTLERDPGKVSETEILGVLQHGFSDCGGVSTLNLISRSLIDCAATI